MTRHSNLRQPLTAPLPAPRAAWTRACRAFHRAPLETSGRKAGGALNQAEVVDRPPGIEGVDRTTSPHTRAPGVLYYAFHPKDHACASLPGDSAAGAQPRGAAGNPSPRRPADAYLIAAPPASSRRPLPPVVVESQARRPSATVCRPRTNATCAGPWTTSPPRPASRRPDRLFFNPDEYVIRPHPPGRG